MRYVFVDRKAAVAIWGLMSRVADALAARGDEVAFCRLDDGRQAAPPAVPDGVRVFDVPVRGKRRIWDLWPQHKVFCTEFGALVRHLAPDVVHTNFCVPGVAARLVARRRGVPIVLSTQHEMYGSMRPHYRWATRLTERWARAVVYVSHTVARSFGRRAQPLDDVNGQGCPRYVVIHNGVDPSDIRAVQAQNVARDPRKLVCVGRLIEIKGQDVLIRSMKTVLARFPGCRLVLVGSGPREAALKRLAADWGVSDRVRFTGWLQRREAIREAASAAAVIVPSAESREGFGLVAAEAMACGTPVIASRIAVFEEVLGADSRCAFLFKRNRQALAETICQVLGDPREAARRAACARRRVEQHFSSERMVTDYLKLYDLLAHESIERNRV